MADITLAASVSRPNLGLGDLSINDYLNYRVVSLMGGQVVWTRNAVVSAYMDGDVTVNRRRANIDEPVVIDVLGATQAAMQANVDALVQAFCQDSFIMTLTVGGQTHGYYCESADYQMLWEGPKFIAQQIQIHFNVPRRPVPQLGVI